jgi:hypothetical protein
VRANETLPYKYVSVEGPIVAVEVADLERDRRPLARRYLGTELGDRYIKNTRDVVGNVLVRMRPERWLTVDYAKHPNHDESLLLRDGRRLWSQPGGWGSSFSRWRCGIPTSWNRHSKRQCGDARGALIALDDPVLHSYRARIVALAAKRRLPAMHGTREFADEGGLMSYGPHRPDLYRRSGTFVDKILKGAKPADLPVEQPTKFELVINLTTARALGQTIPQSLLLQADEVINR